MASEIQADKQVPLLTRFLRKSAEEKKLLMEAIICMFIVRGVIRFLPFNTLQRLIKAESVPIEADIQAKSNRTKDPQFKNVETIACIVRSLSRKVPWESKCLVQAASARIMLNRRGIQSSLFLGVKKEQLEKLQPHAWLQVCNQTILGGHEPGEYVPVSRFE